MFCSFHFKFGCLRPCRHALNFEICAGATYCGCRLLNSFLSFSSSGRQMGTLATRHYTVAEYRARHTCSGHFPYLSTSQNHRSRLPDIRPLSMRPFFDVRAHLKLASYRKGSSVPRTKSCDSLKGNTTSLMQKYNAV